MSLPIYVVDAFADKLFQGNPAAVCPLQEWLPDDVMQKLAFENNLSETAFFVKEEEYYHVRWFTPDFEVDLCGHATLASAYVIFNFIAKKAKTITFNSKSGILTVSKTDEGLIQLDFPAYIAEPVDSANPALIKGLSIIPQKILKAKNYLLVYESEEEVRKIVPDFNFLNALGSTRVIVTAKGAEVDFVSRFFVPNSVIMEDPVTGSAHSTLVPYWSKKLGKTTFVARQLSKRSGTLYCEYVGDRVLMAGNAVLYSKGEYFLEQL
ncbi:PhzF family phenazine biosynthesis protein [Pinibacter aurantiacus]|uniref:PhzF family phenazine biosynthesis protein n=1 Tax=Pinibacter aurantiacus TaxID=2851599 RepID=A0A9E2SE60_9BACT|nr:PhzF family phenazine biosynthesis protein [Pinibacter aurantiacus]MBV4360054.1 PhzF family phenazine biosynthesis protein [Pinibacter aurantiacus]